MWILFNLGWFGLTPFDPFPFGLLTLIVSLEARLRALFDGSYEFIGLLSPTGMLLEANRAACEWIGQAREEVIGKPFWETPWWTNTPGASDRVRQAIDLAATGEFVRQEVTLHSPQGEVTTFDFSLHPILDREGKVILLVPEGRDITESLRTAGKTNAVIAMGRSSPRLTGRWLARLNSSRLRHSSAARRAS